MNVEILPSASTEMVARAEPRVVILLATFNGAKYLKSQLASIVSQTHRDWLLVAWDDGSTDSTPEILQSFAESEPGRALILEGPPVRSASRNFFRLLQAAPPAEYYALCDQDDVWDPNKLTAMLSGLRWMELQTPHAVPLLAFSDLRVVDSELRLLRESFMDQIKSRPEQVSLGSLIVENLAPGCSMLFNAALLSLIREERMTPDAVIMHDWWLILLAISTGRVGYLNRALVNYRQHDSNTLGTVSRSGIRFAAKKLFERDIATGSSTFAQASALFHRHHLHMHKGARETVWAYISAEHRSKLARIIICVRHGVMKQTLPRRIYQFLKI